MLLGCIKCLSLQICLAAAFNGAFVWPDERASRFLFYLFKVLLLQMWCFRLEPGCFCPTHWLTLNIITLFYFPVQVRTFTHLWYFYKLLHETWIDVFVQSCQRCERGPRNVWTAVRNCLFDEYLQEESLDCYTVSEAPSGEVTNASFVAWSMGPA